jgi:hypothetical protein
MVESDAGREPYRIRVTRWGSARGLLPDSPAGTRGRASSLQDRSRH